MSRETLDGDGPGQAPVSGEPEAALDLDLSLDDAPAVAARPARPSSAPAASAPASSLPAATAPMPAAALPPGAVPPAAGTSAYPAGPSSGPASRSADILGTDVLGTGELGVDGRAAPAGLRAEVPGAAADDLDLDGFSADLGEERVDRKAAARTAGLPLTSVDRRRVRLAALAAGVVLVLVLAAVGGYSEGQKAQDRDAFATARVVGQMDPDSLLPNYTEDGRLDEPVLLNLRLTVTASISGTVTRVLLPTGEARLRSPVRIGPGEGAQAPLELTNLCGRAVRNRPDVTDTTVTLRTTGGDEVTLPLQLGFEKQFLSRESLCGPVLDVPEGDANALVTVTDMWITTTGDIVLSLQSTTEDRLQVAAGPSLSGSASVQGWKVTAVPPAPVVIPGNGYGELVVRLSRDSCFRDDTLPLADNLVALRLTSAGAGQDVVDVDGVRLLNWNDTVVSAAAAARMALQCRR